MNVLIIEDEGSINSLFTKLARKLGHTVEQAFDMLDALAALRTGKFDVICCDIDLGTGTNHGPKALLQSDIRGSKIIFITAKTEYEEAIQPLIELGYDVNCIRKPINTKEFLDLLK
jgi:DNA-binding response OmpR family regulator